MVGPQVKRQAVDVLSEERGFGVTRACGLLMISRSLYGDRSRRPLTEGLRERICELNITTTPSAARNLISLLTQLVRAFML